MITAIRTCFLVSDDIPAVYDLWLLGDEFLKDIYSEFQKLRFEGQKSHKNIPLYIQDFFNVKDCYHKELGGVPFAMTRMINTLISTIEVCKRIPRYLIVIINMDLIMDIDSLDDQSPIIVPQLVRWFMRQVDMILRRKKVNFLDKKPGALTGLSLKTIYVKMLRKVGLFNDSSHIAKALQLRTKFNDALNDAVAKVGQHILTINSCNGYEHFNQHGNLSIKGKNNFWWELDDLLERFELSKIKLLPNPKNPPRKTSGSNPQTSHKPQQRKKPTTSPASRSDRHSTYYY